MPAPPPSSRPFFSRLVEAVAGVVLAQVALTLVLWVWAGSPDEVWKQISGVRLPWKSWAGLVGAATALAAVGGLALALAEHLAVRGYRLVCLGVALALAPVGVGAAVYVPELVTGRSVLELGLEVPRTLQSSVFWGGVGRVAFAWVAIGGALLHARCAGAALREQATATALGGLGVLLLFVPEHVARVFSLTWVDVRYDVNLVLLLYCGPALLLPPALWLGARAASLAMRVLGQPEPTRPSPPWRVPPPRSWWPSVRDALGGPAPGALVVHRLGSLADAHGPVLRAGSLLLGCGALVWTTVMLANPSWQDLMWLVTAANLAGAVVAAVVAIRGPRWPVWGGLLVLGVPYVACLLLLCGAYGAMIVVSALLLAAMAGRLFPAAVSGILVAACVAAPTSSWWWRFLPLGGGWPNSLYRLESLARTAGVIAAPALFLLVYGRAGVRPLIGLALGAFGASWIVLRLVQAAYGDVWLTWDFAAEFTLLTGAIGGALGSWAAHGTVRRSLIALAAAVVATAGIAWSTHGGWIELLGARGTRRAAEAGDPQAMLLLAQQLEVGVETQSALARTEEAYGWYERAAASGNAEAMYRLALRLADGRAPRDRVRAKRLLEQAAQLGQPEARARLADGFELGPGGLPR